MGDDESDSTTWDFGGEETQIFDSPNSSFGNKFNDDDADPLDTLQSTLPFEDTVRCEDELETQVMDLEGETQLFNIAGETQVVNFDDDIEEMDFADTIENNETQLFNDCDTEEVADTDNEGTEVLGVSDEETDDDSANRLGKNDRKENESETNCGTSEQRTSGGGSKTFTSIRAASLRASGLAALKKASQESQSPSSLKLSSEPDIEHQRAPFEKHDNLIDQPGNGSKSGFGRSTARKLFSDDALDNLNNDIALGGLSYIDSQEPGDASQANALDFVDNFLKVNIESGEKCDTNKSTGGKSKPVLTAKGTRVFAKSASLISAVDKRSVFYFDDNLEDDGETEFFKKKKEVFFGSGSRKAKSSISSGKGRKVGKPRRKNMTGLVSSDSKVVLGDHKSSDKPQKSLGTHIKDLTLRKNLINELDEQSTDIPLPSGKDIQGKTEARFDTQMAAEAMEDLCTINTRAPNQATRTTRSKSKSKLTDDQPKEVKKGTKSTAKRKVVNNESKNLDKVSSEVDKRKGRLSLKRRAVVAPETNLDQTSVKKQCIQNVTPVARRTRKSIVKEPNKVETAPSCPTEKISIPTGFHPKGKRSSPKSSSTRLTRSKAAISSKQEKGSLKERCEPPSSTCTTPVNRATPLKESSPVCMGDEYLKQSWRKSRIRASLIQEVRSLSPVGTSIVSPNKDTRERRDISLIRVVFSRHLDGDIIKQQKK
ncbi:hypothetical protein Tco_1074706, partial [Tanacetum coccineum]